MISCLACEIIIEILTACVGTARKSLLRCPIGRAACHGPAEYVLEIES
jgi:hypothetical protein